MTMSSPQTKQSTLDLQSRQEPPKQDDPRLAVVLLSLISILPFLTLVGGPFLFDDESLIVQNPVVHSFDRWSNWFTRDFWQTSREGDVASGTYFRPWVLLSYALDWSWGGGSSWAFHISNLLWCACASALIMSVLLRWCGGDQKSALLAGCLFVLHPSKAESVAWIAGRTDLLLATGLGLCLLGLSWSLGWGAQGQVRPRRGLGGVLQVLGTGVAFGSKELAVVLPVLVVSHVLLFECRDGGRVSLTGALRRHRTSVGWAVLSSLLYFIVRTIWLPFATLPRSLDLSDRALLFFDSCGRYLALLVAPTDLSLFAAYKPLALVDVSDTAHPIFILLGGVHCVAWAGLVWLAQRKRRPRFVALLLAYGACFLPVSNLIPMATDISVSPRFVYLPLLPGSCMLALALSLWLPRAQKVALACVLLVGLPSSLMRARDFDSAEAFWRYELAHNPSVPSVLGANAQVDEDLHQPILAAARRACTYNLAQRLGDVSSMSRMLSAFLHGAVRATPHASMDEFKSLMIWTDDLLRSAPHTVQWTNVALDVQGNQLGLAALGGVRASLNLERAHLEVRASEPRALVFAESAVAACQGCPDIAHRAAQVALLVGDHERPRIWLERAGIAGEPIISGLSMNELGAQLTALDGRANQGDRASMLERALLVNNHDRVVDLVQLHPDWSAQLPIALRLRIAQSAALVGAWEVVRAWLNGLATPEELQVIEDEFMRTSPAYNGRAERLLPWEPGTCARAHELR